MSKLEHHFVLKYTSENGWEVDTDSETARFVDGTIYDTETQTWESAYEGDGKYNEADNDLMDQLVRKLAEMNGE